ncbi:MFS transporter [Solicola sp. PLA-1-18]|uniref:MFS transporter n=1 Tax=Solicola sp. PLA-1-18 TaxID=3380532 RepID=UPI003B815A3C
MSPIASYARLLRLSGPAYVVVAFLGRLPLAMSQLGTLLLVSSATGRYGAGGAAAGALAVANAVGSPFAGSLADRIGQRPVVLVQSLAGALGLVGIVLLAHADAGEAALIGVAAATGLLMPQVGPLARVRWRPITRGTGAAQPRLVDAAFSYEGAADEASFVLGPALVGVIGVLVDPAGALVVAAAVLAVFGTWFALHPSAAVAHEHRTRRSASETGRLVTGLLLTLLVAQGLIGMVFGSSQTGATVLATAVGQPGVAGLTHATLGVGSVIAGLAVAGLPARIGHERRMLGSALALFVLSLPLLLVDGLLALVLVVLALGFAVAPYMISNFTLGERIVPPSRVGAAMTLLAAATGVGYALGSSLAGRLADTGGHTPAFAVTVTATAGAVVLSLCAQRPLRRALAAREVEAPSTTEAVPAS